MDQVLKDLPKIELHRHLEGSIPVPLIIDTSKKFNLPLPENLNDLQVKSPLPLPQVLERLFYQQRCFQNLESVENLTYEVLKDIASDNIKIIELRFSPGFMSEPKNLSFDSIMEAVVSARERAQKDFNIVVGFILISSRDYGLQVCERTVDLAIRWKKEIIGIDLAGDEEPFPPELFEKPFRKAHQAGLRITAHSGEVSSPKYISTSIHVLNASRIGHGVQAIQDSEVIDDLIQYNIPLELCPTSNFLTQAVSEIKKHPLKKLMDAGVPITISSDDPTLFGTTLTQEYAICIQELGLTLNDIKKSILTSFDHSFISDEKKKKMYKDYFRFFENDMLR